MKGLSNHQNDKCLLKEYIEHKGSQSYVYDREPININPFKSFVHNSYGLVIHCIPYDIQKSNLLINEIFECLENE